MAKMLDFKSIARELSNAVIEWQARGRRCRHGSCGVGRWLATSPTSGPHGQSRQDFR
jgi:hypothetical protein